MDDLMKLLDGNVDSVKSGLAGKNNDDLLKLKAGEQAGKKRIDVLAAIDDAIASSDAQRAGGTVMGAAHPALAADLDTSGPANIPAASEFSTSGAPRQVTEIDMAHPAVDADPRAGTTVDQNRIDFNDPLKTGAEIADTKAAPAA